MQLRCSRDLPTCKRCRNAAAICKYPQPPERKLLAPKRVRNSKARAQRESEGSVGSLLRHKSDVGRQCTTESRAEDYRASTPPLNAVLTRTTLPTREVAIFLIEIFFSHLYNATLLFHKASFLSDYHANKVPDFLTLSIYALASMYVSWSHNLPIGLCL